MAEVHNITSRIEGSNLDGIHDKDKYHIEAQQVGVCVLLEGKTTFEIVRRKAAG